MKNNYKNYMVMEFNEDDEDWAVAEFQDYKKALDFAETYVPKEAKRIEIWGTDEDPDTFKFCESLHVRSLTYGASVDLTDEKNSILKTLADRIYDEEGDPYNEIVAQLSTLGGCHAMIEYLLETIDSILE